MSFSDPSIMRGVMDTIGIKGQSSAPENIDLSSVGISLPVISGSSRVHNIKVAQTATIPIAGVSELHYPVLGKAGLSTWGTAIFEPVPFDHNVMILSCEAYIYIDAAGRAALANKYVRLEANMYYEGSTSQVSAFSGNNMAVNADIALYHLQDNGSAIIPAIMPASREGVNANVVGVFVQTLDGTLFPANSNFTVKMMYVTAPKGAPLPYIS